MNDKTPQEIFAALAAPFPVSAISWRVGATNKKAQERATGRSDAPATKGVALAYIDARDVLDRLDTVLGIDGWQERYTETPKGRIICELSVRIGGQWITKSDGAGETDHEGEKGAISDALKRAAVHVGVGRYLYRLDAPWVELDERGNFKRLPVLPEWARPVDASHLAGSKVVAELPESQRSIAINRSALVKELSGIQHRHNLNGSHILEHAVDYFKVGPDGRQKFTVRGLSDTDLKQFVDFLFDIYEVKP